MSAAPARSSRSLSTGRRDGQRDVAVIAASPGQRHAQPRRQRRADAEDGSSLYRRRAEERDAGRREKRAIDEHYISVGKTYKIVDLG